MSDLNITLNATWNGGFRGRGHIEGTGMSVGIAIPEAYGGSGAGTNPKALYVAAAQACFLSTLRAMTAAKKLPVDSLSVQSDAVAGDVRFTIRHTATVVLSAGADAGNAEKVRATVRRADQICAVGTLARKAGVEISVIPDIRHALTP